MEAKQVLTPTKGREYEFITADWFMKDGDRSPATILSFTDEDVLTKNGLMKRKEYLIKIHGTTEPRILTEWDMVCKLTLDLPCKIWIEKRGKKLVIRGE
jgi:hypothetical protein